VEWNNGQHARDRVLDVLRAQPVTALLLALQAQATPAVPLESLASAPLRWAAAGGLLLIVLFLLAGFWRTVRYDPPRLDSHWGGFGGGLGGWHMSASLAFLLGAIAFGLMFTAVVREPPRPPSGDSKKADGGKTDAAKADGAKAGGAAVEGAKAGDGSQEGAKGAAPSPAPKR
jgi:hypothetical protein